MCRPVVLSMAFKSTAGTVVADIAKSRAEIEGARLLVYSAALQVRGVAEWKAGSNVHTAFRSTKQGLRVL